MVVDSSVSSSSTGQPFSLVLNIRSINVAVRNTMSVAMIARMMPTRAPKSIKVSSNANGLREGAASTVASDGPTREDRSYMLEKIGAAQQEQSIKGMPAA